MDLENIKNSTKESIIQNFMENVKHAPRGASHQRPKSWSKGTKSGSDKKKMRREGKDAAREMNENKGTQGKEMMVGGGVGAMDKAVLDAAATFGSEGVHIPKLTPRVQEILKNEMQWRRNLDNQISSFSGARGPGQMTPVPMNEARKDWASRRNSYTGYQREMGERKLESYQREFAKNVVTPLLQQHGAGPSLKSITDHPWWYKVGSLSSGLPDQMHLKQLQSHPEFSSYMTGLKAAHQAAQESTKDVFERGWHSESIKGIDQAMRSPTGDLSESVYSKLKTKLEEQSPMGWHEGDPELESDVMAKHSASLSPEEQDPFHLINSEEREDIHDTLQRPHGTSLVRAGLLGRIQTIASMAKNTQTGKDDPVAMQRISQLIDYGNKAIDQHMKDYMSSSSGQDIPR